MVHVNLGSYTVLRNMFSIKICLKWKIIGYRKQKLFDWVIFSADLRWRIYSTFASNCCHNRTTKWYLIYRTYFLSYKSFELIVFIIVLYDSYNCITWHDTKQYLYWITITIQYLNYLRCTINCWLFSCNLYWLVHSSLWTSLLVCFSWSTHRRIKKNLKDLHRSSCNGKTCRKWS